MSHHFYCKYCGSKAPSVESLTQHVCHRYPTGANKGNHVLYDGNEKTDYKCRFCGHHANSIASLTAQHCVNHPNEKNKGNHDPAVK
jgi:DNA-directed RNA polymerase subunit RPC12/RpoP